MTTRRTAACTLGLAVAPALFLMRAEPLHAEDVDPAWAPRAIPRIVP